MPRLPRAPLGSPVVIDPAVWNYLCDCVERSMNITVSAPLHMSNSPSGTAISIDIPSDTGKDVLLTKVAGVSGTDQVASCTYTYDIFDARNDPSKNHKLNTAASGAALSLTGKGNGWRSLLLELNIAQNGRAYQKPDGTWVLTWVDESPKNEKDCT
jgi:hypothetical protein